MKQYDASVQDFLKAVCRQVRFKLAHGQIIQELSTHVEDQRDEYIRQGYDEETASKLAVEQMGDPVLVGQQLNEVHKAKMEWSVLSLTIALVIMGGAVQFFVASSNIKYADVFIRYLCYVPLGMAAFAAMYYMDYNRLVRYAGVVYGILLGIAAAGFFVLRTKQGAFPHVYPLVFLIIPAFAAVTYSLKGRGFSGIILAGFYYAGAAFACILAPTISGLFLLTVSCLVILTVAIIKGYFGGRRRVGLAVVYIPVILFTTMFILTLKPYQSARFTAMFNPWSDPLGAGYIYTLIRTLVASSQWHGSAIIDGHFSGMPLEKLLPGYSSDFILTYIIARFGFIAGVGIILVFAALAGRLFHIVRKQGNHCGFILGLAACLAISGQIFFFILFNLGMFSPFAMTLPFISFGRSFFIIDMMLIGLVLSVYRQSGIRQAGIARAVNRSPFIQYANGKLVIDLGAGNGKNED